MPKKICIEAGCREIIAFDKTRCSKHGSRYSSYNRTGRNKERDKFYHSKAWKLIRLEVLQRDGGLCQTCKENDKIVSGNIVDHIIEIEDGGEELNIENLEVICLSCHSSKSAKEKKKRLRRNVTQANKSDEDDRIYI